MNVPSIQFRSVLAICLAATVISQAAMAKDADISQSPLFVSNAAPPLNMLVMGRDHKLYYEAYNDASDLNGDGVIDVGYKGYLSADNGGIDYYGYFDSHRCYVYDEGSRQFNPDEEAPDKTCDGKWSGDFLNYLTTSRMDAMRKVFYGGYRAIDSDSETVLERSHIPQDAHSWGKEYTSVEVDGYDIAKYTPLGAPTKNSRHLFANTTLSSAEAWGPRLRVLQHSPYRIWEWVSKERPVADTECRSSSHSCGTIIDYRVRVRVCESGKLEANCQAYPSGVNKPTGILHDYGATDRMYFGLLTGSYRKNTQGGVLRSNIESFAREFNAQTGQFCLNGNCGADGNVRGVVDTLNRLKTVGFNGDIYSCGWISTRAIKDGECEMWGNPIAEMMYESLRYFSGAKAPRPEFDYDPWWGGDVSLELAKPQWSPPYLPKAGGGSGYFACSMPVMTVVSDINPSYDTDLPGSHWSPLSNSNDPESISTLNVSQQVDAIWDSEKPKPTQIIIGESNGVVDNAPTPKKFANFSTIRGLAPEEPTKQGSYYAAGISRFGALNNIGGDKALRTYSVALTSPLPKFEIPVGNHQITLVPYAKSVAGFNIDANADFQPTNQIVDFYVQKIANMAEDGSDTDKSVNAGRPYAEFRINFEDVEQGADHDMDMIVLYTVEVTEKNELNIKLYSEYAAGGMDQHAGYVISGSTADGTYLEVCDLTGSRNDGTRNSCAGQVAYKLNTPPNRPAGWCAIEKNLKSAECAGLPPVAERTFKPGESKGAKLLKDPLWYAAKYGDPDTVKSPSSSTKDPSNYFLVTNALTLKEQLNKAFSDILQKNASISRPSVMPEGTSLSDGRSVYKTSFSAEGWIGDLTKESQNPVTKVQSVEWNAQVPVNRTIKMAGRNGLVDFQWSNLSDQQKAVLNNSPAGIADGEGEKRLDFIKGDRSEEGKLFRTRKSLLGDIINSGPVVVAGAQYLAYLADAIEGFGNGGYGQFQSAQNDRRQQVYIGANDGMLHAFDAKTGTETFAFVPTAVINHLNQLTATEYNHRFYVDGSLVVRDVYFKGGWHTVLIGTLRAGGRSLFALDVTDPDNIELLWEFSDENPATLDEKTKLSDLGYSFPVPAIARLHSGQWGVLMGNGYNSANSASGKAVLFVLDIETGKLISKLDAQGRENENNGLSSIRAADNNGDGVADYAYAGDLQGNLWRFDLLGGHSETAPFGRENDGPTAASKFAVSFSGKPLYTAVAEDGTAQSITALPSLVRHPSQKGYLVLVGTGRYMGDTDKSNKELQTIYGIWDTQTRGETANTTQSLSRKSLQKQTIEVQTVSSFGQVSRTVRLVSDNPVDWFDSNGNIQKWGWYLDLKVDKGKPLGERMVDEMAARGQVLFFATRTPVEDPCKAGLDGWTYGISPFTGGRTRFNVFDLDKSNSIDVSDGYGQNGTDVAVSGFGSAGGGFTVNGSTLTNPESSTEVNFGPNATGRQSWQVVPTEQE
ncbi:hypothetical protein BZL41_02270 [Pseudomonas sp. PIC25]|uniref:pilus assembly protein n=1 Tax=Pseudomonas sp. PIC25 TaxID=1958773 RepID=UPI000BAB441D|nr:PilC/PilY family type IV pilus protein [Pseudomonas sp. PIC25]PAU66310.1 hypothetical protein BZL41_02270 [Pseudomonas sp. PIC25]